MFIREKLQYQPHPLPDRTVMSDADSIAAADALSSAHEDASYGEGLFQPPGTAARLSKTVSALPGWHQVGPIISRGIFR
jgi:hypothetical protein